MSASDLRLRLAPWRACALAALAVSSFAFAQAPSNPTLNAQVPRRSSSASSKPARAPICAIG